MSSTGELVAKHSLPPILAGRETAAVTVRVQHFFSSVASIFESWVNRRKSAHTQRAYREDVMAFVHFMGWKWPGDSAELLGASIKDVLAFREAPPEA